MRHKYALILVAVALNIVVPQFNAHSLNFTRLTCDPIPPTGSQNYNVETTCYADFVKVGASGNWYNAYLQECSAFCSSKGLTNAPSPDGFSCTSGEDRPWSAIGKVDYSPTGCWHSCAYPEGSPGAVSVASRCYSPGQKRDNDRTDLTVGCYCISSGDSAVDGLELAIKGQGSATISGVSATPSGWQRVDRNLVNDIPGRLFDVYGAVPTGSTVSLRMRVNVRGTCGSTATLQGTIVPSVGAIVNSSNYNIELPVCTAVVPQCSDGIDNDGDGFIDTRDPQCWSNPADPATYDANRTSELEAKAQCQDGVDNDNDGKIDYQGSARITGSYANGTISSNGAEAILATGLVAGQKIFLSLSGTIRTDSGGSTVQCSTGDPSRWPIHVPAGRFYNASGVAVSDWIMLPPLSSAGFVIPPGATTLRGRYPDDYYRDNAGSCQVSNIYTTVNALADTGCSSDSDNEERDIIPQCQDGIDNDSDGLTDGADPGCSSVDDNNEADGTSQCQDRIDNDQDGATDFPNDFSCSTAVDTDETNPKSQCQDGVDNDNDGLTDTNDPGCATNQDNIESDGTSQCQDGVDNDQDGAQDLADFSCASPQDNDETNPKAQCQNGSDDDSDGLVDQNDPGCSNAQDNNEGNVTSQCQDNIDNDNDGAIDTADFSCAGPQDNDEANPTSQCQDNVDNDNDGAVDASDFSCSGSQDNDETNSKAQCQNGNDDDSDGLVDLSDPGCSNSQDNNEGNATTQCQDNIDNDSDGAIDAADFSCSSSQDNDETNPKTQCQNGTDEDVDGLVDLNDPGCSNAQDNNEGDGTSQCQDNLDNDNDGAKDAADFSCSSPQDNDETNSKSQCQNGIDDDNDGSTDLSDAGCSSAQDNSEEGGVAQCQDGVDNDGDGATDTADYSCANAQDNDESNPKSQCQDGTDNDQDSAVDYPNDFGCSSKQDNDESSPKAQCEDGVDNDQDGAMDYPADFSCSSAQDDDETLGKSQCQDGVDNDQDGLTDQSDVGCSSKQDNNESDGTSQCQDTKDNDSDGLIDLKDPGCASATDNDESDGTSQCQDTLDNDSDGAVDAADPGCSSPQDNIEGDEAARLAVGLECVTKNVDNTKTAYFSYNNTTGAELSVVSDSTTGTVNEYISEGSTPPPPTLFKSGLAKGVVAVTFTADTLTWKVRAAGSAVSEAVASSTAPLCAPLVPIAECYEYRGGALRARLGYDNRNSFDQQVPVGALNQFTPGSEARGQPGRFFTGLNRSVFEVTMADQNDRFTWNLNGSTVVIDNKLSVCEGGCVDEPTGNSTQQLSSIAQQLSSLMNRAAQLVRSAGAQGPTESAASKESRTEAARLKELNKRVNERSAEYRKTAESLLYTIPDVIKICPEAPAYCTSIDNGPTIDALRALYANQENSIRRTVARSYFRKSGRTSRADKIVREAKALRKQGDDQLAQLNRVSTVCK